MANANNDIFERLESGDKQIVESVKQNLREQFGKVSEPWLLNGVFEYYLLSNSERAMEILVNIKEPHHTYLFDRLWDSLKSTKSEVKIRGLTLMGYIVRSQPTWLYKLQEHALLKELLKLLKNEVDLLPLISALLILVVLLPILPSAMGQYLRDIFEIFCRLASWNCNPGKFVEDQVIHMQVALYALFLRLYGMYPCNFIGYLKTKYKEKNEPVFDHTIKPMLDTVRMHPYLVTASKENETTTERWKKMGVHDVIVECERFSLDLTDRCPHDSCQYPSGFRSRSGTTNSNIESSYRHQSLKNILPQSSSIETTSFFTPSMLFHVESNPVNESLLGDIPQIEGIVSSFPTQGGSPPEAAIEATPETTPVREFATHPRSQSLNPNIARALTLTSFSCKRGSVSLIPTSHSQPSSPLHKEKFVYNISSDKFGSSFSLKQESRTKQKIQKLMMDRSKVNTSSAANEPFKNMNLPPPSSPLTITNININRQTLLNQRSNSPSNDDDEEVASIVSENTSSKSSSGHKLIHLKEDTDIVKETEQGSPCTAGGLHMPNSKSMNSFAKRIRRMRHHSQCNPEIDKMQSSTGSSPGKGLSSNNRVRRTVSCPEIKKRSPPNLKKDSKSKFDDRPEKNVASSFTQTESFWAYEHLFLNVFPSLEFNEIKPSPAPSPAPFYFTTEKNNSPSIYDTLDKYIEKAASSNERSTQYLKEQLQLLHQQLLFEKHRRETHAYRNRRLLSDAKSTRLLEECNSALRDTVQLQQKEIDDFRNEIINFQQERLEEEKKLKKTVQFWENKCMSLQEECERFKEAKENLNHEIVSTKNKCNESEEKLLLIQADLLNAMAEVNIAKQKAIEGERGRKELEEANKELLLMGELQLKYQEKLEHLMALKKFEEELELFKESAKEEFKILKQQLESKTVALESYRNRVHDLENILTERDDFILSQKQKIGVLNEQRFEKLEAVESKYQTQLKINNMLEEKILDLRQQLELEKLKRSVHSPDTSSCHEVNVTTTLGLSSHSSPLSMSLASSEGSNVFQEKEMRNLQELVDDKESTAKVKPKLKSNDS